MLQRFVVGPQSNVQSLGTSLGIDQWDQSRSIHENSHVSSGFDGISCGCPFCNDFRGICRDPPWPPRLAWSIMACILIMWDMCPALGLGWQKGAKRSMSTGPTGTDATTCEMGLESLVTSFFFISSSFSAQCAMSKDHHPSGVFRRQRAGRGPNCSA